MEDTHGEIMKATEYASLEVLILIIMEDTHGGRYGIPNLWQSVVLILIIMEDTHGDVLTSTKTLVMTGLNPYYNGRYSWS